MTDLQPEETFALATAAERATLLVDSYGATSETGITRLLEQVQIQIIEAKQRQAKPQELKPLYLQEQKLYNYFVNAYWRNNSFPQQLELRHNLLALDRPAEEFEATQKEAEVVSILTHQDILNRLKNKLNVYYDGYVQQVPSYESQAVDGSSSEPKRPPVIDSAKLVLETLLSRVLSERQDLNAFSQVGWEWLSQQPLTRSQLQQFLQRVDQPILNNMVDLILRELTEPLPGYSSPTNFGDANLHRMLSLEQLQALKKKKPELWDSNKVFVGDYILKDKPFVTIGEWEELEVNGGLSNDAKTAYLEKLWKVACDFPAFHNNLKGILQFHVLWYDMEFFNSVNFDRLKTYVELPRTNSNSSSLKYRSETDLDLGKVTDINARRALIFSPGSQGLSCPFAPANIFTKCSPANENILFEFAVKKQMSLVMKSPSAKPEGWMVFMNQDWVTRVAGIATLTTPGAINQLPQNEIDEIKSRLGASEVQRLKSSIQLEFGSLDKTKRLVKFYKQNDPVVIPILVKNIPTLLVKIFYIHSRNFYTKKSEEINASNLELDGLTPKEEFKFEYSQEKGWNEFLIYERALKLDSLSKEKRGVFVVELLGSGYRARAILRKGSLIPLSTTTAQGHVFRLIDEETSAPVHGSIYLNGQTYNSDAKTGFILVPYSATGNGNQKIVLMSSNETEEAASASSSTSSPKAVSADSTFATLATFAHLAESYVFSTNFYIDRESLLSKTRATLIVKPNLSIHGSNVNIEKNLKKVVLRIDTTDDEDVPSTQIIDPFQLFNDQESTHSFSVPDNLKSVQFTLSGEINKFSNGEKQEVADSYRVDLNTQEATHFTEDLFLKFGSKSVPKKGEAAKDVDVSGGGEYVIYCLGKSGEPIRNRFINLTLFHEYLTTPLQNDTFLELATDETGCIRLGQLEYIYQIIATPIGTSTYTTPTRHQWDLLPATRNNDGAYVNSSKKRKHVLQQGETLTLPYTGPQLPAGAEKDGKYFYLAEDFGSRQLGRFLNANHVQYVYSPQERALKLVNLPAGHFQLFVKTGLFYSSGSWLAYEIHVVPGPVIMNEYLMDRRERVFVQTDKPEVKKVGKLQVINVTKTGANKDATVTIQLAGVTASTRVHVISSNFFPEYSLTQRFSTQPPLESRMLIYSVTSSTYLKQKLLGDEINYILQRKLEGDRIGNMLPRPTLFLNDRYRQDTQFSADPTLSAGEVYNKADAIQAEAAMSGGVFSGGFGGGTSFGGAPPQAMYAPRMKMQAYGSRGPSGATTGRAYGGDDDGSSSVGIVDYDGGEPQQRHNFEFLSQPSVVLTNLRPDSATQQLKVLVSSLSETHNCLSILALDSSNNVASYRFGLKDAGVAQFEPESKEDPKAALGLPIDIAFRDIRLMPGLDDSKHYSEHHLITCLNTKDTLGIEDVKTSTVESYDSLKDFWNLLQTLVKKTGATSILGNLTKFEWLIRWNSLDADTQDAKYSEFSSHELNLYLFEKDPKFFRRVIQPFIRNKLQKTFVDLFLLEADLTAYLQPHGFMQLNIYERILLARRLHSIGAPDSKTKALAILDLVIQTTSAQIKEDPEVFLAYFKTALQSKSLSAKDDDGSSDGLFAKSGREDRAARKNKAAAMADRVMEQEEELAYEGRYAEKERSQDFKKGAAPRSQKMMMAPGAPAPAMAMACASAPCPPPASRRMAAKKEMASEMCADECDRPSDSAGDFDSFAADLDDGVSLARRLYQAPPSTKEYEERNYYDVTSSNTGEATDLVEINRFWSDYCLFLKLQWTDKATSNAFLTKYLGEPITTFTDVILRLAVLQLPLPGEQQAHEITGSREKSMKFTAKSPVIIFHKEMKEVDKIPQSASSSSSSVVPASGPNSSNSISVSCNYFDPFDLFQEGNIDSGDDRTDKYITDEFLTYKLYGSRIVITNISSNKQKIEILLQIPEGSIPIGSSMKKGLSTTTKFVEINSYSSTVVTYLFYFPTVGLYRHYPPSATKKGVSVGFGAKKSLRVVHKPSKIVKNLFDWKQLSQTGTNEEILQFLKTQNLVKIQLSLICWRFNPKDSSQPKQKEECKNFFQQVLAILRQRLVYDAEIWAFVFLYHDRQVLSELLQRTDTITNSLGQYFISELIKKDAADYEWNEYQHLEYSPLLNARAHTLRTGGGDAVSSAEKKKLIIQNIQFSQQYRRLLQYLRERISGREQLTTNQKLCLTYYLLLQDRITEAKAMFDTVKPPSASSSSSSPSDLNCMLQYDYFVCYFAFFQPDPSSALAILTAKKYTQHPVAKKRKLFLEIENQLMEISSSVDVSELQDEHSKDPSQTRDNQDRERENTNLASTEPSLDFAFHTASSLEITYENISEIKVNFFKMNVELMFSSSPFMLNDSGATSAGSSDKTTNSFLYVTPNDTITLSNLPQTKLGTKKPPLIVQLPPSYLKTNCWIEVTNSGASASQLHRVAAAGAGGLSIVKPYFAHQLNVQLTANYGQVKVSHAVTGKPLPQTYVKVYGKPKDGTTPSFYKDGYTDLRGRFNYSDLSTDRLSSVSRFSILILNSEHGAVVKQADPPQQ